MLQLAACLTATFVTVPVVTLLSQWCYSGVTVVLQWCYSGVTVVLQWCCSGDTRVLLWCYRQLHAWRRLPWRYMHKQIVENTINTHTYVHRYIHALVSFLFEHKSALLNNLKPDLNHITTLFRWRFDHLFSRRACFPHVDQLVRDPRCTVTLFSHSC
jgi:hypothetical protein